MKQKALSLADVERNCDKEISASYIGKVVKGTVTNLTADKMVALARGLQVSPFEVFEASYGEPLEKDKPDAFALLDMMQQLLMNPDILEAIPKLLKLSAEDRKVYFQPLRFLDRKKPKKKKNS
jgi:hypothetical protein